MTIGVVLAASFAFAFGTRMAEFVISLVNGGIAGFVRARMARVQGPTCCGCGKPISVLACFACQTRIDLEANRYARPPETGG